MCGREENVVLDEYTLKPTEYEGGGSEIEHTRGGVHNAQDVRKRYSKGAEVSALRTLQH